MPESNLEEVIDGELSTMPPATKHHNAIVELLHLTFLRQMNPHLFCIQGTGFLLNRDPLRYRIPDLAIVDRAALKNDIRAASDPYSHIVPQLIIEVVSPANRKGSVERLIRNYADFGVPEVLLFYPETRTYESYRSLDLTRTAQAGSVSPQTMPEVLIDLDQLWTEF